MRRIGIVLNRDFRELKKTTAFLITNILFAVITITASLIIVIVLKRQVSTNVQLSKPLLELIIGLIAYFLPLSVLLTFIWAFTNLTIIEEKVSGNIESLLATPLSPREIWIGKSMAIFLPGYAISSVSTFIILLTINLFVIIPATGKFILPAPLLLQSFIINPLLFLALLLFTVLFSLANNPNIAIAPSFLIGFGLMIATPLGIATGTIALASWSFIIWCSLGAITLLAANFIFYHLLTKENIVLSCKGD